MSTELAPIETLPDLRTGEVLPATKDNAARVLLSARDLKRKVDDVIRDATDVAVRFSELEGTKTLHGEEGTIKLTGGPTVEYDPELLMELLADAGCPEERIAEAVVPTVAYKVNRSVLRQLAGANPQYKAAVELAERPVEKRYQATVEPRKRAA